DLQLFERQLQLVEHAIELLGTPTELHAPQLGEHQFHMLDFPALGGYQGFQGLDVVREAVGRAGHGAMLLVFSGVEHQIARSGAMRSGRRQSILSNSIASCAVVKATLPLVACGQTKRPCSSRLQNRHKPSPSHHSNLIRSPRSPRNTKIWPENRSASSGVCTRAARPSTPRRMSVTPAAIQM